MKRFLLAAALAVALHGLLLSTEADWLKKRAIESLRAEPITLTISYRQPQRPSPPPTQRTDHVQKITTSQKIERKNEKTTLKPPEKIKPKTKKQNRKPEKKIRSVPQPTRTPPIKKEETLKSINTPDTALPLVTDSPPEQQGPEVFDEAPGFSLSPDEVGNLSASLSHSPPIKKEATPLYRKNPRPKYPRIARRRGYEGTVILDVLVTRKGEVGELRLFQSSGYGVLDRAAMASVRKWLFEPGTKGDQKVDMWVKIPIRFQLK